MTDSPQVELTVVTILYRSSRILAETLPTWIRSARGLPVKFVFADNSPDSSCEHVLANYLESHQYLYLPDRTNPGFAAGCNRAVASVITSHTLLLNPDVWLEEDALSTVLANITAEPGAPIAVELLAHGQLVAGISMHPLSLFIDRRSSTRRAPLGPSGGAAVFPTALFQRLDGLWAHMFAWGEDADLAFRLYSTGVRTRTLALGLRHHGGHSVEGSRDLLHLRTFLLARNRILVAGRNFSAPLVLCLSPLATVAHLALAARKTQQGLLAPFLRGVIQGLVETPAARRHSVGPRFGVRTMLRYLWDRGV